MASVPASIGAASSSTSAEDSAADHTLEELEAMVEELEKVLPNLSESTEMLVLNWWLWSGEGLAGGGPVIGGTEAKDAGGARSLSLVSV